MGKAQSIRVSIAVFEHLQVFYSIEYWRPILRRAAFWSSIGRQAEEGIRQILRTQHCYEVLLRIEASEKNHPTVSLLQG